MYGGDMLARAGDVLTLVSQLPSAAPGQSHDSRDLVSPLEPTLPILVGCIGVRGGIWVTYSDALQLILAESLELQPNVHGGLSSAGVSVRGPYFNERYVRSRDPEHRINVPVPDASTCICLIRHAQPRVHMNVPQLSCQMIEMQDR
ncbi:MAG: hypothetical protein DLM60_01150 [Pseudonocardiales bacterium]|nr:MAG: hypothetical protein DLM60_01150 [Pseudonocardiales bacterium]